MNYFLNKLKAPLSICIVSFMSIALSQNEEEKTPLWIEKGDIIISIKTNAIMSLKARGSSYEKIIKYIDVDHNKREIYYIVPKDSKIFAHQFDDIEYFKPLKKGIPYAVRIVALSGVLGAGLGYYSIANNDSENNDSEKIFQTAFSSAIISGFIGSYFFSEKRPYISSYVYIDDDGESVRKFPEFIRIEKNEWRIIE